MIIFDCDGVLVDSEILSNTIDCEELARHGMNLRPHDLIGRFLGQTKKGMYETLFAETGRELPPDFATRVGALTLARYRTHLQAIEGVAEAVAAIPGKRCVASSSAMGKLRLGLEVTGLLPLFEPHVFSADQVARGKPAPDLFLFAANRMDQDPARCLVVEDSPAGVTAARAAGMVAIGFVGGGHIVDGSAGRLTAAGAVHVCAHMSELPAAVARLSASLLPAG